MAAAYDRLRQRARPRRAAAKYRPSAAAIAALLSGAIVAAGAAAPARAGDDAERTERIRRVLQAPPAPAGRRLAASGTAFAVAADGRFLTNRHVVDGCGAVTVTPPGGSPAAAGIVAADKARDLALLSAPAAPQAPLPLGPGDPAAGTPVAVVGYPSHGMVTIVPVLETGSVMPNARPGERFMLSADVRRGNSGGPVIDRTGVVVGVLYGAVDTPRVFAETGRVVRDIGAAISAASVRAFLAAHGITPPPGRGAALLADEALLESARASLAQVRCWR